jgi:hypothetical protein
MWEGKNKIHSRRIIGGRRSHGRRKKKKIHRRRTTWVSDFSSIIMFVSVM